MIVKNHLQGKTKKKKRERKGKKILFESAQFIFEAVT